ncbi:DNA repair protein RecN [Brachyspira pilosicoli]|uniref:DNA repair protein RecN n=1 Tax=Brachyspira pilosicoli TaxID=52584 RepID=A0AAJ6GFC4_BRAPL|nr:DNA repair protein RecN [Brachyspira pilosicoli]MBW5393197.1 DNA repair protein RecN [Brachyspira pilosicoli]WIH86783.1 DNA repair protein RecN [Brachyspira pilosicoli]WIH91286.1 DNA repair protein RecN [Brachyspira pilosicoli]WIH93577.1 DNA repair protein RecN [Brachyspira pilosicoli]WIH95866.1 DNA repair protein RecN [Brachyspira pilosicoli]
MLKYLDIRNFVLIDKVKINFENGFNVLTGETGAGKSIIISALELITGEKGSTRMVGLNGDRLTVIGTFFLQSSLNIVKNKLKEWNIEITGNELNIKREITKDGKSRSFINNIGVRVAELKELGDLIVDIHGQHEHQSLFNAANHINFYDAYLNIEDKLQVYREHYNKLTKLIKQYNEISQNKNTILKEKSFLEYAIEEIEKANLKYNEDEEIKNDIAMMSNAENIASALSIINKDIFGSESGAYLKLTRSINTLQSISQYDDRLSDLASQIEAISLNLEDIKTVFTEIRAKAKFDPEELQALNERLFFINTLKKKYGNNIKEIINYAKEAKEKLDSLNFSEEDILKLKEEIENIRTKTSVLAKEISDIRKSKKDVFINAIEKEMCDLGMTSTKFDVEITYDEDDEDGILNIDGTNLKANSNGIDNIEFIIAPNKQAMFQPLRKIASGGEISRIMLSLKSVLSSGDYCETCVFDEIDVGVGGRIAEVIGEKIAALSKQKQILSITHLAQIAIYANNHFKVIKNEKDDVVTSTIEELNDSNKVNEIARMITGKEITDASIKHAEELLEHAKKSSGLF